MISPKHDSEVMEMERQEVYEPEVMRVIFYNDDITLVDFVIEVLINIFKKTLEEAVKLTKNIHEQGQAVVGYYREEVAEMKREETIKLARKNNFPLRVDIE